MRRWWKHTTEKTYEEMWSWELREELCGRDATIAEQAATIERFRAYVELDDTEKGDGWWCYPPKYQPDANGLESIQRVLSRQVCAARALITDADMGRPNDPA